MIARKSVYRWSALVIAPCLLAGALALASELLPSDDVPVSIVKVDTSPVRGEAQPLRLRRTGFEYRCSECHKTFESPKRTRPLVAEHAEIALNHGRNDYCLNCHHNENRDAYTTHDGSEIPSDQPAELCAKCHGLVHRDWLGGAHGRRNGYWNPEQGESQRLLCVQCHDPHSPKFAKLKPMPGPTRIETGGKHE